MSAPADYSAGLVHLPVWLESPPPRPLSSLLCDWVRASRMKTAGIVLPAEPTTKFIIRANAETSDHPDSPPAELSEVASELRDSRETTIWQLPRSSGRLYARLEVPDGGFGVIWAERGGDAPWGEIDRNYLRLTARLVERSSALRAASGVVVDAGRLRDRLADAAIIAGRMAHDFDNILTGIVGFADLSLPLADGDARLQSYIQEISRVAQRGIVFTQQLHQLSRSGQVKPQAGQVAAAVAKEESRLRPSAPPGATILTDIPAGLAAVAMEAGPLQTIMGHLLENALEACGPGGMVQVSARSVELNQAEARQYLGQAGPGAHVEVAVRDNGKGITPEVRAKLFVEPFYTTKVRHRGLGLAIVYRTLQAHRGGVRIDAATPPDSGTIVRVVIPLAAARPAVIAAAPVGSLVLGGTSDAP